MRHSEAGKSWPHYFLRSGRPVTAVSIEVFQRADAIVREGLCITT